MWGTFLLQNLLGKLYWLPLERGCQATLVSANKRQCVPLKEHLEMLSLYMNLYIETTLT